jgi:mRNA-degrading endonuclease RelE of RelBE toxin-antitoxin system
MKFNIERTDKFSKSFKKLAKKYKNIKQDYEKLLEILQLNNNAIKISENIYKIRLQNSSNTQGKSGGFRVIYFLKTSKNTIYLLDIFSKNEVSNIDKNKIMDMVENYGLLLK